LNEMQLEFIGRIRNASIQMQDLVLNLLEIARMEMSPEMQTEAVNLHGLLTYVVGDFHNQAEARGHILSLQLTSQPFSLRGDKLRLEQVMRNLVSNAIKYTPDGGKITVKTECLDKKVYVSVADTGIGIPPESLPFIFDQFYRVQTPETQNIEGNGLGLAIVKSIIDKHGGQIKVESNYGQGSCFTFWLKANPE